MSIIIREVITFTDRVVLEDLVDGDSDIYTVISEEVTEYDIYIGYMMFRMIFQRDSDSKLFRIDYQTNVDDADIVFDETATEVFPYTYETTGYL